MKTLIFPIPPSSNRFWRSRAVKGVCMVYVTTEAKDYKRQVALLCRQAGVTGPIRGRVSIEIKLYPRRPQDWKKRMAKDPENWDDTVQCLDLDNINKVLLDSLKGIAIEDDKWVRKIISERMEPDGEARVEVVITAVSTTEIQPSLI